MQKPPEPICEKCHKPMTEWDVIAQPGNAPSPPPSSATTFRCLACGTFKRAEGFEDGKPVFGG